MDEQGKEGQIFGKDIEKKKDIDENGCESYQNVRDKKIILVDINSSWCIE